LFTKHDLPFAKRRDNFAEKESRNPKGDTASKTISLSKKKQIQKVLSEWIKQLGGNSPKHQQPVRQLENSPKWQRKNVPSKVFSFAWHLLTKAWRNVLVVPLAECYSFVSRYNRPA